MSVFDFAFVIRFSITLFFIAFLSYGCYFRITKNADFAASFMLFGTGVFVVIYFLHGVDMSMGFAFGLFAVFTMLRYRTESISIKEMTYLFLVIAIALLTAVTKTSIAQLIVLNAMLCAVAYIIDSGLFGHRYPEQVIQYEKIKNIKPENINNLISDLAMRTGLDIVNVKVNRIDFLRDSAELSVWYRPSSKKKQQRLQAAIIDRIQTE
ncbi:MAG: hypothetical protein ACJAT7_000464 [Psychromonas sp.]|jgi:hypothetical protein|uniref:DUF4956 domain-containing protein n=1 Tax=Psychromonas sp. TaxID=1884585 RepID=UPI0039E25A58